MSSSPKEMEHKDMTSSSNDKELKTEADNLGLTKKAVDEELKKIQKESDFKKHLVTDKQKSEEIQENQEEELNVKKEMMSDESEIGKLLIEYEPKGRKIVEAITEEELIVAEVSNSELDLVAKSRLLRHDSIEIKEEYISDEDINNQDMISNTTVDRLKRPHSSGADTSSEVTKTKKKRVWNYNLEKRRQGGGEYHRLCEELSKNEERYYKYFHMSHETFEELHDKLSPNITKMYSSCRTPIMSRERLMVCLRYLASGDSYGVIATSFQLGRSTVSKIVRETCTEIWNILRTEYMPEPSRKVWEESERGFADIFNFPNCVGCVDGKHVSIKCPNPSKHDNYDKKYSRIVLLAVIDPWCKFTAIDIGDYGYPSDKGIFEETEFYHTYIESLRKVIPSKTLPGTTSIAPRVFIGDEAFALQPFLLRPYPISAIKDDEKKRKFNERLKEPRTVVKDAFDMLTKNWKIFSRPLESDLDTSINIIRAACCLHNYVIKQGVEEDESESMPEESEPKKKSKRKKPKKMFIPHKPSNRRWTTVAARIREMFVSYFDE